MSEMSAPPPVPSPVPAPERTVVVQMPAQRRSVLRSVLVYVVSALFIFSVFMNVGLMIQLALYRSAADGVQETYVSRSETTDKKVAIVSVAGVIADSEGGLFSTEGNFRHVLRQLEAARKDDKVIGVVLEVNSPGGSANASDIILHEVERVKKAGKRVVVWMGDIAASGGYYVSSNADRIYACHQTLTGSIGVILGLLNVEELSDKIGVKAVIVKCGQFKDMGSPYRGMTEAERTRFQKLADAAFERFKLVVREGRKLTDEEIDRVADGAIFSAREAQEVGLVDRIGYLEEAVDDAAGKVKDASVVRYRRAGGLLGGLLSESKTPSGEVHVHIDSPLPVLSPGLHYLWLPGAALRP